MQYTVLAVAYCLTHILSQAEKILIDDFVILSLFYGEDYFLKNPDLIVPDTPSLAVIDLSLLDFKSR